MPDIKQEAAAFLKIAEVDTKKRTKMFEPHDFKKFPELTNSQLSLHGASSPHAQHLENFSGECVKVMDGDTCAVQWGERDFPTKVRFENIAAPEIEEGGEESREWMTNRILGKIVDVQLAKRRTGKWGRIIGKVFQGGMDVGIESVMNNHAEAL